MALDDMMEEIFRTPRAFRSIEGWDGVPANAGAVDIRGAQVKDFAPLAGLRKLHSLCCSCISAKQYAVVAGLKKLDYLWLVDPRKGSLAEIGTGSAVRTLRLEIFKPPTLDGLEAFESLEHLFIWHAPKITSLEPIGRLSKLRILVVSTPPSWDSSRRTIRIESLSPLARTGLTHLSLTGVQPMDGTVKPLASLENLRELEIENLPRMASYGLDELARQRPDVVGRCLGRPA